MNAPEQENRYVWLDALRLIAGLSMVGLHATADATGQPFADYTPGERLAPMLLRAVLYTARTELFLIISVFLLLLAMDRRPKTYGETIAIQARRLLVPFAFWTLFYAAYNLIKAEAFGYSAAYISSLARPAEWVGFFLLGDVKYHMHFIPTLFGLLLFFPIFHLARKYPVIGVAVLACLAVKRELDVYVWSTLWGTDLLPFAVRGIKILTYVGYGLVAGACLGVWQHVQAERRSRWTFGIVIAGGFLFLVKLTATAKTIETGTWQHGYVPGYWADFLMPVVLFAGCMSVGHKRWPAVLSTLAPFSFGIYLAHPIFLDLIEIALRGLDWSPMQQVAAKILFTLPLTALCVWVLSRSKALGWTIGLGALPRFTLTTLSKTKEVSEC